MFRLHVCLTKVVDAKRDALGVPRLVSACITQRSIPQHTNDITLLILSRVFDCLTSEVPTRLRIEANPTNLLVSPQVSPMVSAMRLKEESLWGSAMV